MGSAKQSIGWSILSPADVANDMKYGALFVIAGILFAVYAAVLGGWGWLMIWPAVSFALVGIGYLGAGPAVFGKRPNGRMAPWCLALLLPYLLYS